MWLLYLLSIHPHPVTLKAQTVGGSSSLMAESNYDTTEAGGWLSGERHFVVSWNKPGDLSLNPGTHIQWKDRTGSVKLPSALYVHTPMVHTSISLSTPPTYVNENDISNMR